MDSYKRRISPTKGIPSFSMGDIFTVSLSVPTDSQDANDVIAATQLVSANAFLEPGGIAMLHHLYLIDTDDQKAAVDIVLLFADIALGTEDSNPNISDANIIAARPLRVQITASDYHDYGGGSVAEINQIGKMLKAPSDSTSLWVAASSTGTPTYASGVLTLGIGLIY